MSSRRRASVAHAPWTLASHCPDLAVALSRVAVAGSRRARPQRRSGAGASSLRPAPRSRCCRPFPWAASSSARPARPAARRARRETVAALPHAPSGRGRRPLRCPAPTRGDGRRGREAQPLAKRAPPAAGPRPAPSAGAYFVDVHGEHRARPSAVDRDRADERVSERTSIWAALGRARPKLPSFTDLRRRRAAPPARVERREGDRCLRSRSSGSVRARARNSHERWMVERDLVRRHRFSVRPAGWSACPRRFPVTTGEAGLGSRRPRISAASSARRPSLDRCAPGHRRASRRAGNRRPAARSPLPKRPSRPRTATHPGARERSVQPRTRRHRGHPSAPETRSSGSRARLRAA